MSSVQLLDKTRKIGKLLHNNNSSKVVFSDICKVMREILNSNVLVISRKGKVLGVGKSDGIEPITELLDDNIGGFIDPMLNERLLGVLSTKENVNLETLGFENTDTRKFQAIITPIEIAGERLGTLFIYKCNEQYDIDDIILCVSLFYYCVFVEILYNKIKWVYGRKRFLGALVRRPRNVR